MKGRDTRDKVLKKRFPTLEERKLLTDVLLKMRQRTFHDKQGGGPTSRA